MDPAFNGVGQQPNVWIWRIEKFQPVPYDRTQYGKFYSGDCYIVLKTKLDGTELVHDIYFWLGKDSSQDEWGTAAIKSVELDDSLGGKPIQHREVQEHESKGFLSNFKKGIQYLNGGVASGFRHVTADDYQSVLFHVKGRRNIRVKQVEMSVKAMNKGDCFILDTAGTIYLWAGPRSRRTERLKAIQTANQIRDTDHAGKAAVVILDEFADGPQYDQFFTALGGGSSADVAEAAAAEDDVDHERTQQRMVTLYRVTDGGDDTIEVEQVAIKPLKQNMLKSEDCFILDTGSAGFYVWIGRGSTKLEKEASMQRAVKFMQKKNLPPWTRVERVIEGGESAAFRQYFRDWKSADCQEGLGRVYTTAQIAESVPVVNLATRSGKQRRHIVNKSAGAALGFMPDDGAGKVQIFRIENFEPVAISEQNYGMFFGGDSYIIKYTYMKQNREHYIIYFWQGSSSSQDERTAAALHAVRMDDELCGRAVQIRVTQGREPRHFLTLFKGRMIVFMGGHASGFRNIHDHDTYDVDGTRLFHVRGLSHVDTRAVQVPETAASLTADDVFVLETPKQTYIWHGQDSCDEEKSMAENVAGLVSPGNSPLILQQGSEPAEFWASLGGAPDVSTTDGATDDGEALQRQKKLMHCYVNEAGDFLVEEVEDFQQEDLNEDDVMVLDTGDEVYCWIGADSTQQEKQKSFQVAERLISMDVCPREGSTVIRISQGNEPSSFKSLFPSWADDYFQNQLSYENARSRVVYFGRD